MNRRTGGAVAEGTGRDTHGQNTSCCPRICGGVIRAQKRAPSKYPAIAK